MLYIYIYIYIYIYHIFDSYVLTWFVFNWPTNFDMPWNSTKQNKTTSSSEYDFLCRNICQRLRFRSFLNKVKNPDRLTLANIYKIKSFSIFSLSLNLSSFLSYIHIHTYIYVCVCVYIYIYIYIYIHTHTYIYIYTHLFLKSPPFSHICSYTRIYVCVYTHTHTHTYIYIYIYIYMCVCIYTHTHTRVVCKVHRLTKILS